MKMNRSEFLELLTEYEKLQLWKKCRQKAFDASRLHASSSANLVRAKLLLKGVFDLGEGNRVFDSKMEECLNWIREMNNKYEGAEKE